MKTKHQKEKFKEIRSKKIGRMAILTDVEKQYLRGTKKLLNTKNTSKLFRKLDDRLHALFDDLQIIRDSNILKAWRASRGWEFHKEDFSLLDEIFSNPPQPIYPYSIKRVKKKKQDCFWVDFSSYLQNKPRITPRIFDKDFLLRDKSITNNIKQKWGYKLLDFYDQEKIPTTEKDAATLTDIGNSKQKYVYPK